MSKKASSKKKVPARGKETARKTAAKKTTAPKSALLIDVTADNVTETGFFCMMSKPKSPGYQQKLAWLQQRFREGMRIKMAGGGGRAFIEYIPGEYAWRPVEAKGYFVIHCLWVVGQSKGRGIARSLLNACIEDARASGAKGVAMVTSEGNWLLGKKFLETHGFTSVDQAPPSFELMVLSFGKTPPPRFSGNWEKKCKQFGRGLTIVRTDQCPYLEDATRNFIGVAEARGIPSRVMDLKDSKSIREKSPSAYGVFNAVLDGRLLSYCYLTPAQIEKALDALS